MAQLVAASGNGWLNFPPSAGARQTAHGWQLSLNPSQVSAPWRGAQKSELVLAGCPWGGHSVSQSAELNGCRLALGGAPVQALFF